MFHARRRGFTLVEVAMAVAIGLIVIGVAVLAYRQVRITTGDKSARDRLSQFKATIEGIAAQTGTTPSCTSVGSTWKTNHPTDYKQMPWSGGQHNTATTCSGCGVVCPVDNGANDYGLALPPSLGPANGGAANALNEYLQWGRRGGTPTTFNETDTAGAAILTSKTFRNYWVGYYGPNGEIWRSIDGM